MSSYLLLQLCPICLVQLGWFVRGEINDCTVTDLWGVASRICSIQHAAFLCCSYLAFSPNVLFASM